MTGTPKHSERPGVLPRHSEAKTSRRRALHTMAISRRRMACSTVWLLVYLSATASGMSIAEGSLSLYFQSLTTPSDASKS
eukprot:3938211-Rhodomonas_salina.1